MARLRLGTNDLMGIASIAAPFTGAAAPFIEAGLAGVGMIGASRARKKQQQQVEAGMAQEQSDRARIEQEIANADQNIPTATDQLALALQARRGANQQAMAQSDVARANIAGSPAGTAMLSRTGEQLAAGSDALTAHLADVRDARKQRAIYQLPALSARRTSLLASLPNQDAIASEALATGAAQEFGRTISTEGSAIGNWMARRKGPTASGSLNTSGVTKVPRKSNVVERGSYRTPGIVA